MTTITLFTHEFPPILLSGTGNTARLLSKELLNRGYKVNVVTIKFGKYSNLKSMEKVGNLTVRRIQIPFFERLLLSIYGGFFSWLNRKLIKDSDVIHALDVRNAPFIYKNKPFLINVNDYASATIPINPFKFPFEAYDKKIRYFYYNLMKFVEAISLKRADFVIFNSRYTADAISRYYKIPHRKIRIIKKGVNVKEFNKNAKKEDIMLFVGGNLQGKGIEELLYATSIIAKKHKEIKVVIIGRGSRKYLDFLNSIAVKLNIKNNVEFFYHLPHDEVINYYLKSRMFVLPTYREGLGQAILEAMAAKLPVVSTETGGIPEVVVNKKTGFLVKVHEVNELASNIAWLLENPQDAREMGMKGYERVRTHFSEKKMVEEYVKVYEESL